MNHCPMKVLLSVTGGNSPKYSQLSNLLIATKVATHCLVIEDEPLMEFGTRRAQEMDAGDLEPKW